ncbi:MAG: hypothetical protein P9M14_05125 [Candidatus Alcyoniella australis]|nr:hypothetical protein [Candidatus Alcyoniella australis]
MIYKLLTALLALLLILPLLACSDGDDDDDDALDDDDSGDDDDDDDQPPSPALIEPLTWGRYVCGEQRPDDVELSVGSFNLHGGKEASAERIASELTNHLPLDLLTLQECPEEYAQTIAAGLEMELFYYNGLALLSGTTLVDPRGVDLVEGRSVIQATTTIEGLEFSAYAIHISWNESGDNQCRQLVNEFLAADPCERIVMAGDWNDELGSTQIGIMLEVAADAWSSLGVWPSARVSWPAQLFYGAEGAQLIDNTLFNKSSGACAVSGEIVNFTPPLSDHKFQRTLLRFPATAEPAQPQLLDFLTGFGADSVGLLFDRPLSKIEVELSRGEESIELSAVSIIDNGQIALLRAVDDLPTDGELTVRVLDAVCTDGVPIAKPFGLTFANPPNLLRNGGAENNGEDWELDGMQSATELHHVTPLLGERFFSGTVGHKRGWAVQQVGLEQYAAQIDAGRAQLALGGACRTGYIDVGTSNALYAFDESEALVELYDADGALLRTISSGRFDTLYWQPWRTTVQVPPGARLARVTLRAVGGLHGDEFNSAAFDALSLSIQTADEPGDQRSGNLIVNPDFDPQLAGWTRNGPLLTGRDHWLLGNFDIYSFSGEYWLGAALLLTPAGAEQTIELDDFAAAIDRDELSLRWGAALRSLLGDAASSLTLSLLDENGVLLDSDSIESIRFAEWFLYQRTAPLPPGTRSATLGWLAAPVTMPVEAAFLDEPFVYVVDR